MGRAQRVSAAWPRAAAIAATLAGAGCTFTHRYAIPQPVVDPAPASRIDATVGVRYEPDLDAREVTSTHRMDVLTEFRSVVPVGTSVRALCDDLLPRLFARPVPLAPAGAATPGVDAVLDVRLASFELDWPRGAEERPCRARIALAWTLATAAGEPIAEFATEAVGEQPRRVLGDCIGDAVALALQDAGGAFARRLLSDPSVDAWLRRSGIVRVAPAAPATPARAAAEPSQGAQVMWGAAPDADGSTAPPRPVRQAKPLAPGSSAIRFGAGPFRPQGTPGALEDPGTGVALLLGATYRPVRPLGIDLDLTTAFAEFSSSTAPPPGTFQTKSGRMQLASLGISAGVRGIAPLGAVEPWAGAGVMLVVSRLSLTGTTLGLPGSVDEDGVTVGAYAGAGLDLAVSEKWLVGAQCRWIAAEQDFGQLSANRTGNVGGPMCLADAEWTWP